jgi:hypothetical protein
MERTVISALKAYCWNTYFEYLVKLHIIGIIGQLVRMWVQSKF